MISIRKNGLGQICADECNTNGEFFSFKLTKEQIENLNDDVFEYEDFLEYRQSEQYETDRMNYKNEVTE